jgi:CheY-like chemotaxis protein
MANILVIDDEDQLRFLVNKMLTRDGHQVMEANDGVEGLQCFYQLNPDLVITDIIMPNKDGIEVIADLLAANPNQSIVVMSGGRREMANSINFASIEMLGVKGILQKPFTHQQLRDVVEAALS